MVSSRKGLSLGQQRLIEAFFSRTDQFFLTGGSALSGYYLHHRTSADLDFFTVAADTFIHGKRLVDSAVAGLNGKAEVVREYPGFVELQAVVDGENLKVDLVHDTAPQLTKEKPRIDGAVIDSVEDIAANKVCATLGRAEVRDLIDLFFLARAGVDLEHAVKQAEQKDAGVEPATLAWVLGQVRIKEIPSTVLEPLTPAELQAFVDHLAAAWARGAFPK